LPIAAILACAGLAASGAPQPPAPGKDPCQGWALIQYRFAENLTFAWTKSPRLDQAPKKGSFASVGGRPFALTSVEIWRGAGEWELHTSTEGTLGPALTFPGAPRAGLAIDDAYGPHKGYFQLPDDGVAARCFAESTSFNGEHARSVRITKFDGKHASGRFVTTWEVSRRGGTRRLWAGGTFTDAPVVELGRPR
jgi:hypothetical protein